MDPQETFQAILAALGEHDWELAQDASDALRTWINQGGFPPVTLGADSLGADWHAAIAAFICDLATSRALDTLAGEPGKGVC